MYGPLDLEGWIRFHVKHFGTPLPPVFRSCPISTHETPAVFALAHGAACTTGQREATSLPIPRLWWSMPIPYPAPTVKAFTPAGHMTKAVAVSTAPIG